MKWNAETMFLNTHLANDGDHLIRTVATVDRRECAGHDRKGAESPHEAAGDYRRDQPAMSSSWMVAHNGAEHYSTRNG